MEDVLRYAAKRPALGSLSSLCALSAARHMEAMIAEAPPGAHLRLRDGLRLPRLVCDALVNAYQDVGYVVDGAFVRLFEDVAATRLTSVSLLHSIVTDRDLQLLLRHGLRELSLTDCPVLSPAAFLDVLNNAHELTSLTVGYGVLVPTMPQYLDAVMAAGRAPNLERLSLCEMPLLTVFDDHPFLTALFDKCANLTVLDLSNNVDVGSLRNLNRLLRLHTLILSDTHHIQVNDTIRNICKVQSLVVLDLSQTERSFESFYDNADQVLEQIVYCLPNLMYLDISGTNLDGIGPGVTESSEIPALQCRAIRPLEFLGLYRTVHRSYPSNNVPAKNISGCANQNQLFCAANAYMNRPKRICMVLSDLFDMMSDGLIDQIDRAFDIVLEALNRHIEFIDVQLIGFKCIEYMVEFQYHVIANEMYSIEHIISASFKAMEYRGFCDELWTMVSNIFFRLNILEDNVFGLERVVRMMLQTVHISNVHPTQLGRVDDNLNDIKESLGDAGIIEIILKVITEGIDRRQCNAVFKNAWSLMRHITDGTPINCERFLDRNVLECFFQCINNFPEDDVPVLQMIGVFSSIAQVKRLRPRLMNKRFIEKMSEYLFRFRDGIEISYNAACIVALLASDGHRAWIVKTPSRRAVLERMNEAIHEWNLDTVLKINYNYTKTIIKLARVKHIPQCVHLAVWTLANLTRTQSKIYCEEVLNQEGIEVMNNLLRRSAKRRLGELAREIQVLAVMVINQCVKYLHDFYC